MTSHTIQIFLHRLVKQSAIVFSAELVEIKLKKRHIIQGNENRMLIQKADENSEGS